MKLLLAISAPTFGRPTGARAAQYEWTNLAALLKLVASRVEMGQPSGHIEPAQIIAAQTTQQGEQQAPADATQQQQARQATSAQRPATVQEAEWDAAAGRPNNKFWERVNGLIERDQAAQARKDALPKSEAEYLPHTSPNFQLPAGIPDINLDLENDPMLPAARKLAMARGLDQETFSAFWDIRAAEKARQQALLARAREQHTQALGAGPAAAARVDAVVAWLGARSGDEALGSFIKQTAMAPFVRAFEKIIRSVANLGGADQRHREAVANETKIPGYQNMSMVQIRSHQILQNMNRGGGSRGER